MSLKWSYGITTVPQRADTYFPRTLDSLGKAGFPEPYVFVDGISLSGLSKHYYTLDPSRLIIRGSNVRTAGHWVVSMMELYFRHPEYDRYALFQDDLVTYRNLRAYLDRAPYPERGYLNLYTFPSNQSLPEAKGRGWFKGRFLDSPPDRQTGRGAVALVFSRDALMALFTASHLYKRAQDPHRGHRVIDGGVVTAMNEQGWWEYCHSPSLVQHTGDNSSMGNLPHLKAVSFLGEAFDALQLLDGPAAHSRSRR